MNGTASPTRDSQQELDRIQRKEVLDLIERKNWSALMSKVEADASVAKIMLSSSGSGTQGNLALHEVCKYQPSLPVLDVLLQSNPSAVKAKGFYGYLPLHYACTSGASKDVVKRLLEAYPGGTRTRDDHESILPLHLCCKWGSDSDVIIEILANYPEGIFIRDAAGKVPMDHAKKLHANKEAVIQTLKLGPTLVICSKAAQRRVADEYAARTKGMEQAHSSHMVKWEEKYHEEHRALKRMEKRLETEAKVSSEKLLEMSDKVKEQALEVEKLLSQKSALHVALENAETETKTLKEEKDSLVIAARVPQEDMIRERDSIIESLNGKISILEGMKKTLEKKLSEATVVKESYVDKDSIIESLHGKIAILEDVNKNLEREIEEAKDKNDELSTASTLVDALQLTKKKHEEIIARLRANIEEKKIANGKLESKADELGRALSASDGLLKDSLHDLLQEREITKRLKSELDAAMTRTKAYEDRIANIKALTTALSEDVNNWTIEDALPSLRTSENSEHQHVEEEKKDEDDSKMEMNILLPAPSDEAEISSSRKDVPRDVEEMEEEPTIDDPIVLSRGD